MPCTSLGSGPTPSCIRRGPWLMQTNTWRVPKHTASDSHMPMNTFVLQASNSLFSSVLPAAAACYRGFRLRCQGRAGHNKKTTHTSSRVVSSWYWPARRGDWLGPRPRSDPCRSLRVSSSSSGASCPSCPSSSSSCSWDPSKVTAAAQIGHGFYLWIVSVWMISFVVLCSVLTIVHVMCGSGRCKWLTLLFCSCPSRSGYGFHRILWELCGYYWSLACAFHLDILLCS